MKTLILYGLFIALAILAYTFYVISYAPGFESLGWICLALLVIVSWFLSPHIKALSIIKVLIATVAVVALSLNLYYQSKVYIRNGEELILALVIIIGIPALIIHTVAIWYLYKRTKRLA
jgi:hypothetical protein